MPDQERRHAQVDRHMQDQSARPPTEWGRTLDLLEDTLSAFEKAMTSGLILRRGPIGWNEDDLDVVAAGVVVGRIFVTVIAPEGRPWMWMIGCDHHNNRTPTHGYEPTREAAMAAFAKSWRRE
jgi:hypothetical protein